LSYKYNIFKIDYTVSKLEW